MLLKEIVNKFDKRIQKLSQNPSATGLQSTRLAYEMIRDYYRHLAEPKRAGEFLTIHDGFIPSEILDAMEIKILNLEFLPIIVSRSALTILTGQKRKVFLAILALVAAARWAWYWMVACPSPILSSLRAVPVKTNSRPMPSWLTISTAPSLS